MPNTSSVRVLTEGVEKLQEEWKKIREDRDERRAADSGASGRLAVAESRSTIAWSWLQVALVLVGIVWSSAIGWGRIGQLSDDIAEIDGTLKQVRAAQQANSTSVARLGDEVKRFDERLRRLEDSIEDEDVALARRESLEGKIDFKISEIDTRLVAAENRIGTLRKNVDRLDEKGGDSP